MNQHPHRPRIGKTTRSAFTDPGNTRIGDRARSPFRFESAQAVPVPSAPPISGDDLGAGAPPPTPAAVPREPTGEVGSEPPSTRDASPSDTGPKGDVDSGGTGGTARDPGAGTPIPPPTRTAHLPLDRRAPDGTQVLRYLLAAWLILWLLSFIVPAVTPREGDGFTRGLNRVYPFLGYQAIAGVLAFGIAYVARSVRRTSKRWALLGLVPLGLACLLLLGIISIVVFARM